MWYLRQLVPTKFATAYRRDDIPEFCSWWMWMGRCFKVHTTLV